MMNATKKSESFYTGQDGWNYHMKKRLVSPSGAEWIARIRGTFFQDYIEKNDVVVELGVGSGWNLRFIDCGRKIGIDIADCLDDVLKSLGILFFRSSSAVADGEASVVICHHMLEHCLDPASQLKEVERMLANGGRLLLNVPHEKEKKWKTYNPADPNHHLFAWSVQSLGNLVETCGFQVESIGLIRAGYDGIAARFAERFGLGQAGFRFIRSLGLLLLPMEEIRCVAVKAGSGGAA